MKTPQEWAALACEDGPILEDFIAAIQQDARRQGYTEAAEIISERISKGWHREEAMACQQAILSARDNLTTP